MASMNKTPNVLDEIPNGTSDEALVEPSNAMARGAVPGNTRPAVAETVLDVAETLLDDAFCPVLLSGDIVFDEDTAAATGGRMAACARDKWFVIHADQVIGSGSQGIVVYANDIAGNEFAAKITFALPTARDRRNRKAVLDHLIALMDDHPLGKNHYKQTHLMPVYAYGKISDGSKSADGETQTYDVAIMALADGSLDVPGGSTYEELRSFIIPQTAEGLRALHAQGIVHRDIKPKNLYMLDGSVVLGDYGISSLLDAGRDTGATVFDKRTPGYSPHSSVVQRENDWYALGYTIWTLYNGGAHPHQALIDAGDLSAVLAGKRPVEFVPKRPEEAALGELIYGLTLESSRGRLGYDAVQEWLEDPASFHFHNPFESTAVSQSYQFKGRGYSSNAALADVMAASWEEAEEHLYSQTLERYFTNVGQHDLAVSLHRITAGDAVLAGDRDLGLSLALTQLKGSASEFCWEGAWHERTHVADRLFEQLTTTPSTLYDSCERMESLADIHRFLLAAHTASPQNAQLEPVVRAAYEDYNRSSSSDVFLMVDKLLTLLELLCEDKTAVRQFFIDYGPFGDAVWMKRHISVYKAHSADARAALGKMKELPLPDPATATMEELRTMLADLDSAAGAVSAYLPDNPFDRMLGIEVDAAIEITDTLGYQVAHLYEETCTIGFVRSLMPEKALEDVCDLASMKDAAVKRGREAAASVKSAADAYEAPTMVYGRSRLRHVVLMACVIFVWLLGQELFVELGETCMAGFVAYGPMAAAGGGLSLDAWLAGLFAGGGAAAQTPFADGAFNSCAVSLSLASIAFTVCAFSVFLVRLFQLIPVVFANARKSLAESRAQRIDKMTSSLESLSLQESKKCLFANAQMGTAAEVASARRALSRVLESDEKTERVLTMIYRVSLVVMMLAIAGATISWLPVQFVYGVTSAASEELSSGFVVAQAQGIMLVLLAAYDGFVLKKSDFLPNMVAVVAAAAAFMFLLAL